MEQRGKSFLRIISHCSSSTRCKSFFSLDNVMLYSFRIYWAFKGKTNEECRFNLNDDKRRTFLYSLSSCVNRNGKYSNCVLWWMIVGMRRTWERQQKLLENWIKWNIYICSIFFSFWIHSLMRSHFSYWAESHNNSGSTILKAWETWKDGENVINL